MPRPHIEFLHAQQLSWAPAGLPGPVSHGVEAKVLSRDSANGACSTLLRYPAGFAASPCTLASAHEFLVIAGSIDIGPLRYGLDDYAYLPAGYPHAAMRSDAGAVVLTFFDRDPGPGGSSWDRAALIERIDTHNTAWTRHDIDPSVQFLNLAHKVLRHVPETGEKTLLLASGAQTHPHDWREARLAHDCVEEMYLLGGDIIGERGTMYEGAYFWRPPGEWHGPFGSRRGSLSLIRFCDGRHHNIWSQDVQPFVLEPAHRPTLPADLTRAALPWNPARY